MGVRAEPWAALLCAAIGCGLILATARPAPTVAVLASPVPVLASPTVAPPTPDACVRPTPIPAEPRPTPAVAYTGNLSSVVRRLVPPEGLADEYLARHAQVIGVVEVVDEGTARWDTPEGGRPTTRGPPMYRPFRLRVVEAVKGACRDDELVVKLSGGTVGSDTVAVMPPVGFARGLQVLVFLRGPVVGADGVAGYPLMEKATIWPDGTAVDDERPNQRWPVAERMARMRSLVGPSR
jgi:hypothetical protein